MAGLGFWLLEMEDEWHISEDAFKWLTSFTGKGFVSRISKDEFSPILSLTWEGDSDPLACGLMKVKKTG